MLSSTHIISNGVTIVLHLRMIAFVNSISDHLFAILLASASDTWLSFMCTVRSSNLYRVTTVRILGSSKYLYPDTKLQSDLLGK